MDLTFTKFYVFIPHSFILLLYSCQKKFNFHFLLPLLISYTLKHVPTHLKFGTVISKDKCAFSDMHWLQKLHGRGIESWEAWVLSYLGVEVCTGSFHVFPALSTS